MRLIQAFKLALVPALVASQPAAAALSDPPPLTLVENPYAEFRQPASNGYVVSVSGSGRKVRLTVQRELASATYVTRGRVSRGAIKARFGHFGLISMRFKPTERIYSNGPPEGCSGHPELQQRGVFVGTIRFRGEEGYVTVDSHRVKGHLGTRPHWHCPRGSLDRVHTSRERPGLGMVALTASTPDWEVRFGAFGLREKEGEVTPFSLQVVTREQRASVRITRSLLYFPERDTTFTVADNGKSATLRPAKPFHGDAIYDATLAPPERWSGTLSVTLLGATVALAGPRFRAKLKA